MRTTRTQSKQQKHKAPIPAVFDISSRYMAPTIEVAIMDTLVDPKRDTGMRIIIRSPQSEEAREAARTFRASITVSDEGLTAEQIDALFLAQIAAVTVSWSGFTSEGKAIDCTPMNARALYANPQAAWIYQQVFRAFMDTTRFFVKPRRS